ncbi:MAG: hypothetical protein KAS87_06500 [Candidatus Omnitrophica bacterium]|nr:hypothetical protein [Candidatus Omnitrophota bacterium]
MRIGWKVACAIILIASTSVVMIQFQPKDGVLTKVIEIKVQKGAVEIPNSTIASVMTNLSVNKSFNSGLVDKRGKELIISQTGGNSTLVYITNLTVDERQSFENCFAYIKIYNSTIILIEGTVDILSDAALGTNDNPIGDWDLAIKFYGNTSQIERNTNFDIIMDFNADIKSSPAENNSIWFTTWDSTSTPAGVNSNSIRLYMNGENVSSNLGISCVGYHIYETNPIYAVHYNHTSVWEPGYYNFRFVVSDNASNILIKRTFVIFTP